MEIQTFHLPIFPLVYGTLYFKPLCFKPFNKCILIQCYFQSECLGMTRCPVTSMLFHKANEKSNASAIVQFDTMLYFMYIVHVPLC